jgi:hypothetical protein
MTMLQPLRRLWRDLTRPQQTVAIFIPHAERGDSDAVDALLPLVRATSSPPVVVLRSAVDHFLEVIRLLRTKRPPTRVVLFAHPTDARDGFAINPGRTSDTTVLRPDWWTGGDFPRVSLMVAHVCEGAQILRKSFWRGTFSRWISYECVIEAYVASELGRERWGRIVRGVMEAAVEGGRPTSVLQRIQKSYLDEMIRIDEAPDYSQGDTINLINFERAFQNVSLHEGLE